MRTEELQGLVRGFDNYCQETSRQPLLVDRVYNLAINVLHHFMGSTWLEKNITHKSGGPDYFRAKDDDDTELFKNTCRVIRVAELLFNLQPVGGFSRIVSDLSQGDIEPFVTEAESSVILLTAGIPFAFVQPTAVKGESYDIEIRYENGWQAAVEIKSILEDKPLNENTVKNAIKRGRTQLPKDKACFVFVKIPDDWCQHPQFETRLQNAVHEALRQTTRITTVFVWWQQWLWYTGSLWKPRSCWREFENPNAAFDAGPVRELTRLSWNKQGKWVYLAGVVSSAIKAPTDGSVGKIVYLNEETGATP